MTTSLFAVYRSTHFNGNMLEVRQPFGFFHTREEAHSMAEALYDSIHKNTALRGFSFTFYVHEESVGVKS